MCVLFGKTRTCPEASGPLALLVSASMMVLNVAGRPWMFRHSASLVPPSSRRNLVCCVAYSASLGCVSAEYQNWPQGSLGRVSVKCGPPRTSLSVAQLLHACKGYRLDHEPCHSAEECDPPLYTVHASGKLRTSRAADGLLPLGPFLQQHRHVKRQAGLDSKGELHGASLYQILAMIQGTLLSDAATMAMSGTDQIFYPLGSCFARQPRNANWQRLRGVAALARKEAYMACQLRLFQHPCSSLHWLL